MADRAEEQPQAFDAKKLESAKKRKFPGSGRQGDERATGNHLPSPASRRPADGGGGGGGRDSSQGEASSAQDPPDAGRQQHNALPTPSASSQASSTTNSAAAPPKLKRPGQRARISEADREHIRQRAAERERQFGFNSPAAGGSMGHTGSSSSSGGGVIDLTRRAIDDVVRAHYNAVPERGRDWRKTDSRIKGLRAMNNWVKSCIIQKFSPDEGTAPGERGGGGGGGGGARDLLVLDMGCGKGGDLGKWAQAPQHVQLYVGLDPADVSIEQARDRYRSMGGGGGGGRGGRGGRHHHGHHNSRLFEARFQVKDCFAESIADVDIVQQVGFSTSTVGGSPDRGFDVVSMMFCMHYAFETEAKARRMLQNVAGALKKGGRLVGCIPNSDVISERVMQFNERLEETKRKKGAGQQSRAEGGDDEAAPTRQENGHAISTPAVQAQDKQTASDEGEVEEGEADETAEWGNAIYRVRFPGATPRDGVFRPPFGWKYSFFLAEAVEEVPEYVVPWEAFRALAEDYNLELEWRRPFREIWDAERDDPVLGPLSERMGVRERGGSGRLLVSDDEMEAAEFYLGFCFYKV